ncbi:MAG TPA: glycosyltransferase [Planctomycetota bacterium]|jgi:glycosyltransferase involved in cell wall biosynthesis
MKGAKRTYQERKHVVTDDLIRQVSEMVVARRGGARRSRRAVRADGNGESVIAAPEQKTLAQPRVLAKKTEPPAPVIVPVQEPLAEATPAVQAQPQFMAETVGRNLQSAEPVAPSATTEGAPRRAVLAVFCYYDPQCAIGRYVARVAPQLGANQTRVHLFSRKPFNLNAPGVLEHIVASGESANLLESAEQFANCALAEFETQCAAEGSNVTALGFEWVSVKILQELAKRRHAPGLLSLHSLECQRSDLSSPLSRSIQSIELQGLEKAQAILIHNSATAGAAGKLLPPCKDRLVQVASTFPIDEFSSGLDAGEVKKRYQVGPIDPTVLFIGNLDERHGPDIMMKSVPGVLKNHPQARFIFVGDGKLIWPLRVHARYLGLEYAVRLVGHLEGKPLRELVEACDVMCVPSRERTEDWPIFAAWAAKKPLVVTHQGAGTLVKHEQEGVLVYAQENSCVWGIERYLFDEKLRKKCSEAGNKKLIESCDSARATLQLEELIAGKHASAVTK